MPLYKVYASGLLCAEVEAVDEARALDAMRRATLTFTENKASLEREGFALRPGVYNLRVISTEVEEVEEMSDDDIRNS